MRSSFFRFFSANKLHIRVCILAFFWVAGFLLGVLFAALNGIKYASMVISCAQQNNSLVIILLAQFTTLLFFWLACYRKLHLLIYIFCFFKMLIFGFCAESVYSVFSSAGWLVSFLMLFSQVITSVPVFWLAMKVVRNDISCRSTAWLWLLLMFVAVSAIDCFSVSPLLSSVSSLA